MSHLAEQIHELAAATDQMQQAALTEDWKLAKKIQQRRALLIERIVAQTLTAPLAEEQAQTLNDVRQQADRILARANARQRALGQALADIRAGTRKGKQNRMKKAYGAAGKCLK